MLIADATGIMLSWSDEDGECYQAEVKPLVMEGRAGEPGPDAGTIRAWAESVFAALVGGAW